MHLTFNSFLEMHKKHFCIFHDIFWFPKLFETGLNVVTLLGKYDYNVLFTLIRTKCSSVSLLYLVRNNVNKTLDCQVIENKRDSFLK